MLRTKYETAKKCEQNQIMQAQNQTISNLGTDAGNIQKNFTSVENQLHQKNIQVVSETTGLMQRTAGLGSDPVHFKPAKSNQAHWTRWITLGAIGNWLNPLNLLWWLWRR